MVPSVIQRAVSLLDHTILSIVIALQFLGCLGGIATLLLFSRYPGADFNVLPGMLFFGAGIAAAVVLHKNQKKEFWRRLPALGWHAVVAGYVIRSRGLVGYSALFSVGVALYLGITAAVGFSATRIMANPRENSSIETTELRQ